MMSNKKTKIHHGFRLDAGNVEKLRELPQKDPLTYPSQAMIVDAALHHFFKLNKSQQKEVLKSYLTRDL